MRTQGMRLALTPVLMVGVSWYGLGAMQTETVNFSGDRVEINGIGNDPTGDKVEAGRFSSPAGDLVVWTYPSKLGPCYDLVYPNGDRSAGCLKSSGIDADQPVAGGRPAPEFSHAINPSAFNYGLATGAPIGMVHHGAAHPTVAEIRVVPTDGTTGAPLVFTPVKAPNVEDFWVMVAYAPAGTTEYRLEPYDADGCMLTSIPTSVSARASEQPEELHGGAGC